MRVLCVFAMALVAALLFLQFAGLPGGWALNVLARMQDRGLHLDARRITLDVVRGIVLHQARLYEGPARRRVLIQAEQVALGIDPLAQMRGRPALRSVKLRGGAVQWRDVSVTDLDAGARIAPTGVVVSSVSAQVLGVRVHGRGSIGAPRAETANPAAWGADLLPASGGGSPSRWVEAIEKQLLEVRFLETPEAEIDFDLRADRPAASRIAVRARGGRAIVRGLEVDAWRLTGRIADEVVHFEQLRVEAGGGALGVSGTYGPERNEMEIEVDSTLPPAYLEGLAPTRWRRGLDRAGLFFGGPVRLALHLGPAAPADLFDSLRGRVRMEDAELRDIQVAEADLAFVLKEDRLVVSPFEGRLGAQGTFRGEVEADLAERSFRGRLQSHFDYAALLPVLEAGNARLVRSLQFESEPPEVDVAFEGRAGVPDSYVMNGSLRGTDFFYRGTHVNAFRAELSHSNRVTTLSAVRAERDEGFGEGLVRIDHADRRVDLDLRTTAHPSAAGRVGGDTLARILGHFRFEGPTDTRINGSVYYGPNGTTDLHAQATGRRIGLKWFLADEAAFDLHVLGRTVLVTNLVFTAFEGSGGGTVRVYKDAGADWRFDAGLAFEDLAFGQVVKEALHREGTPQPGQMDLDVAVEGLLAADFMPSLAGTGRVRVSDAQLLQIALFGGLSRGLSFLFPGLGFATQSDFTASYALEGGRLSTQDARLEGAMLSLSARGDYGLVEHDLDFIAEVRLLREQGIAASVVHLVTFPISKLLQFDLSGTLEDPVWRPRNLPKEMFLIFE